jgi:hypothetical protein
MAVVVLRVRAGGQGVRVEIELTAELHDALGDPVGVLLLLGRMLQELGYIKSS